MIPVRNKDRRFGSAAEYWLVRNNGKPFLFTATELHTAQARAESNLEDIPKQCWWNWLLDFFKVYE